MFVVNQNVMSKLMLLNFKEMTLMGAKEIKI